MILGVLTFFRLAISDTYFKTKSIHAIYFCHTWHVWLLSYHFLLSQNIAHAEFISKWSYFAVGKLFKSSLVYKGENQFGAFGVVIFMPTGILRLYQVSRTSSLNNWGKNYKKVSKYIYIKDLTRVSFRI